jgi:very-short-patch-repair endonuclease
LTEDLALTRAQVAGLRGRGELVEVLPSTYRLTSHPDTFLLRAFATQLWAHSLGFLSSWSAARIYGLRKMPGNRIHFTAPASFSRRCPEWVHLDRSGWFDADRDRDTLPTGLIVATPERMLWGLAADVNQTRFDRAAEDAWHRRLITPSSLGDYLEAHRCRGKDGTRRIERWLRRNGDRTRPAQSHLEMEFVDAFVRHGLPEPERQHSLRLTNGEVIHLDIAWPNVRLAVEPGSSWYHGGDDAQARDHDRDLACSELGWSVIRLADSFRDDVDGAARRVARAHAQRVREVSVEAS